jgi:uncharacterized membrane protein YphA (DoxX/SURF4 family)
MNFDERLNTSWWTLRIALGLVPILAGLDKYMNLLANWEGYLHPGVPRLLGISDVTIMHVVGVVEIAAGIIVLSRFTRFGAYIVMAWLICIALSLVAQGRFFDVAVRDLVMSTAAFTLAKLTEVREAALVTTRSDIPIAQARRAS